MNTKTVSPARRIVLAALFLALAFLLVLDLGTANIHQAAATGTAAYISTATAIIHGIYIL